MRRLPSAITLFVLFFFLAGLAGEAEARKRRRKDFKGLFGSYKKEKYIENEGRSSDWGLNLNLGTFFPVGSVATSNGGVTSLVSDSLHYATFFNVEVEFFVTMAYRWELYLRTGINTFSTRRENTQGNEVRFHELAYRIFPAIGGIRYRFSKSDVVPYIGVGGGVGFTRRSVTFLDFNPDPVRKTLTAAMFEGVFGFEFFFGARGGLRLEVGGVYLGVPQESIILSGQAPTVVAQGNPIFVRYSSGIFFLL